VKQYMPQETGQTFQEKSCLPQETAHEFCLISICILLQNCKKAPFENGSRTVMRTVQTPLLAN
jgi:hypothetical protein